MTLNITQFPQTRPAARIYVRIQPSGLWDIQDEMNRRGGRFIDRKSALQFIRHEFGTGAQLVFWTADERQAA